MIMRDVVGWYQSSSDPGTTAEFLDRFRNRSARPDSVRAVTGEKISCVGPEGALYQSDDGSIVAVVVGRPYWKNPRYAEIASSSSVTQSVAEAYRADPDGFLNDLYGGLCSPSSTLDSERLLWRLIASGNAIFITQLHPKGWCSRLARTTWCITQT